MHHSRNDESVKTDWQNDIKRHRMEMLKITMSWWTFNQKNRQKSSALMTENLC